MNKFRNVFSKTLRQSGKFVGTIGLAGLIMATSACGGSVEANPSNQTTPIPSGTVAASPKSSIAGTAVNGIPTKPELAYDGKNYYVQTTIADDDPAMTYNPNITTDVARNLFTPEELKEGQIFATKFVAEEVLDSTLNDNYSDKDTIDKWVTKNKEKFAPEQYDSFVKNLNRPYTNEDEVLVRGGYRENKYELTSGVEQTRILSRSITPTVIRADTIGGKPYVEYEAKVRVAYKVKVNGQDTVETVDAKLQTILYKDPTTGKWGIAGANNIFTPTFAG